MTIQKRELAFQQAHERFGRYIGGCDRDVSPNINYEFVANLLMEFSDVASMALDALADFVPEETRTLNVDLARENLRAMILRPQPERAMPEAVSYAEKHVLDAMSGPQYSPAKLREILFTLYDSARNQESALRSDVERLYDAKFPPTPGRFDTSFSATHERAWKRENETRRANDAGQRIGSLRSRHEDARGGDY
jgi:hypothetical protein